MNMYRNPYDNEFELLVGSMVLQWNRIENQLARHGSFLDAPCSPPKPFDQHLFEAQAYQHEADRHKLATKLSGRDIGHHKAEVQRYEAMASQLRSQSKSRQNGAKRHEFRQVLKFWHKCVKVAAETDVKIINRADTFNTRTIEARRVRDGIIHGQIVSWKDGLLSCTITSSDKGLHRDVAKRQVEDAPPGTKEWLTIEYQMEWNLQRNFPVEITRSQAEFREMVQEGLPWILNESQEIWGLAKNEWNTHHDR